MDVDAPLASAPIMRRTDNGAFCSSSDRQRDIRLRRELTRRRNTNGRIWLLERERDTSPHVLNNAVSCERRQPLALPLSPIEPL